MPFACGPRRTRVALAFMIQSVVAIASRRMRTYIESSSIRAKLSAPATSVRASRSRKTNRRGRQNRRDWLQLVRMWSVGKTNSTDRSSKAKAASTTAPIDTTTVTKALTTQAPQAVARGDAGAGVRAGVRAGHAAGTGRDVTAKNTKGPPPKTGDAGAGVRAGERAGHAAAAGGDVTGAVARTVPVLVTRVRKGRGAEAAPGARHTTAELGAGGVARGAVVLELRVGATAAGRVARGDVVQETGRGIAGRGVVVFCWSRLRVMTATATMMTIAAARYHHSWLDLSQLRKYLLTVQRKVSPLCGPASVEMIAGSGSGETSTGTLSGNIANKTNTHYAFSKMTEACILRNRSLCSLHRMKSTMGGVGWRDGGWGREGDWASAKRPSHRAVAT